MDSASPTSNSSAQSPPIRLTSKQVILLVGWPLMLPVTSTSPSKLAASLLPFPKTPIPKWHSPITPNPLTHLPCTPVPKLETPSTPMFCSQKPDTPTPGVIPETALLLPSTPLP